jgi:hypothetical protein
MGKWTSRAAFLGIAGVLTLIVTITRGEADNPFPRSSPTPKGPVKPVSSVPANPLSSRIVAQVDGAEAELLKEAERQRLDNFRREQIRRAIEQRQTAENGTTQLTEPFRDFTWRIPADRTQQGHHEQLAKALLLTFVDAETGLLDDADRELIVALNRYVAQKELNKAIKSLEETATKLEGTPEAATIKSAIDVLRKNERPTEPPARPQPVNPPQLFEDPLN